MLGGGYSLVPSMRGGGLGCAGGGGWREKGPLELSFSFFFFGSCLFLL